MAGVVDVREGAGREVPGEMIARSATLNEARAARLSARAAKSEDARDKGM